MTNLFETLQEQLSLSDDELLSYLHTVPLRYKRYYIDKRNSTEKRLIAQPSRTVKILQKYVASELEEVIPVHQSAMAYCKGRGIKENAKKHAHSRYLLKMDLKRFFDSITPAILSDVIMKHGIELSEKDYILVSQLFFWKLRRNSPLRLSIGAPSSPFVSNAIMYFFDEEISKHCEELNIVYTRYADDMTFSTNKKNVLFELERTVVKLLRLNFGKDIKVNKEKTVHSSKAHNRHVTGVTLSNTGKLSIGRENKRSIRVSIHRFINGKTNDRDVQTLKGSLGFAKHIEPEFVKSLEDRYGVETIKKIQTFDILP
ncbi:retron St85 family RNA-directed DNA polymerase [Vibrio europaeus]|uniref:retron St85 family RNA-directed DNA polymerase n=1 Tax=Vibrio oreintalis group TaxID=1891919 RepID=UPI001EFC313C|nr:MULTISPECIES: retron St85 family RNA-directed DNA polymerase [Vibrio oreintalis group]MCG9579228.1 retron St85 family RNA-directed DNA polymerase [Vibrio tubiashii]MDC5754692.1 retron St85 family RNA-directed DNA polymerase [Vibrio europaeus]MDC5777892.1 retron St85 family RNA-directed DNA polymerase [Vibrio europaeus]MDC5796242.1 retron St85 family RNA-directed DNA polymerase [Vibrio europaeus]MDC5799250.1 retron St85 family RNA-directed DNA polymerase [Vibrio europaeus]